MSDDTYAPVLTEDGWKEDPEYVKAYRAYAFAEAVHKALLIKSKGERESMSPLERKGLFAAMDEASAVRKRRYERWQDIAKEVKTRHQTALDEYQKPSIEELKADYLREATGLAVTKLNQRPARP